MRAILTAIRRASSFVSSLVSARSGGHRLGRASLMTGGAPLPVQLPPLSSSRAKQPGWCLSSTVARKIGRLFFGFRVKMRRQTTHTARAAKKIASCACCIVVTRSPDTTRPQL
jgi:hypothetical protein